MKNPISKRQILFDYHKKRFSDLSDREINKIVNSLIFDRYFAVFTLVVALFSIILATITFLIS
jgi:hypothetical protein